MYVYVFAECVERDLTARMEELHTHTQKSTTEGNSICIETAFVVLTNDLAAPNVFTSRRSCVAIVRKSAPARSRLSRLRG